MKDLKLLKSIIIGILGCILFNKTPIGLNTLIITLIISSVYIYSHKRFPMELRILNITSIGIFISPTTYLFILWLINILYLSHSNTHNSFLFTPIANLSRCYQFIKSLLIYKNRRITNQQIIAIVISVFIIYFFGLLYTSSNPLINDLFQRLDLDFINLELLFWLILFTSIGIICLNKSFPKWFEKSMLKQNIEIYNTTEDTTHTKLKVLISKLCMYGLSVILFFVNISDIFVLTTNKLPSGLSHSQYVHQGFYTLIISMVLAIVCIIFMFKGNINFSKNVSLIKKGCYLWIIQNVLLCITTLIKNLNYIASYGLTYNRLFVILCLLIIASSLYLSFLKVRKNKSLWYFTNRSSIILTTHFILFYCLPFDYLITNYNTYNSSIKTDYTYILRLKNPNWEILKSNKENLNVKEINLYNYKIIERKKEIDEKSILSLNLNDLIFKNTFQ